MSNLITDGLQRVKVEQKACRAARDTAGVVAVYNVIVNELLTKLEAMSASELAATLHDATNEGIGLLSGSALGGAIWAVRKKDAEYVKRGLRAVMILDGFEDYRELLILLTLLDSSAQKLRVALRDSYAEIQNRNAASGGGIVEQYLLSGGKTLGDMGYVETTDKAGEFTYSRVW